MKWILLAAMALVSAAYTRADAGHVAGFADLPEGDRLVINYVTLNCFGPCTNAEFVYSRKGQGEFEVAEIRNVRPFFRQNWTTARIPLGRISLESDEARQLDALVAAYRKSARKDVMWLAGYTTYTLTQMRGNRVVAQEIFRGPEDMDLDHRTELNFSVLYTAVKQAG